MRENDPRTNLDDPLGVLRGGTSTLMTMDFAAPEDVDAEAITSYVAEAVSKFDEFLAGQA